MRCPLEKSPPGSFLDNLLSYTRFTTHSAMPTFLPRRVGLGYPLVAQRAQKDVIKQVLKEARKRREEEDKAEETEADESEDGISRMGYIMKKRQK